MRPGETNENIETSETHEPNEPSEAPADQRWLVDNASALGVELATNQLASFAIYQRELIAWNRRSNLTAITDPAGVQVKHFADSLACLIALGDLPVGARVIDVGTGAGFPGLPIKIVRPDLDLTLLEATRKKTLFLEHVCSTLQLAGVRVVTARAEDAAHDPTHREAYDVVLARAVAELRVLAECCLPFARVGGVFLAQKKAGIGAEIADAGRAITLLGGRLLPRETYRLPSIDDERWLIGVEKIRPTSAIYPRRAGLPAKQPL